MTERNELPFHPANQHDTDIAQRFAALYVATPTVEAGQVERCARSVLAQAVHQRSRSAWGTSHVRWWWGAAAAAALVTMTLTARRGAAPADVVGVHGAVTTLDKNAVRFDLRLPSSAKAVAVVGDFNGWDEHATPMAREKRNGSWSVSVPMAAGRHVYAFVVDGAQWVVDPMAPQVPNDGYGPANAVVVEGLPK